MNRTSTRVVDYQRLLDRGRAATIVVKLMMACNDMQLANEALSGWKEEQPRNRQYRQIGAKMYFVRVQMAHLHEALNIIEEQVVPEVREQGSKALRDASQRLSKLADHLDTLRQKPPGSTS